MLPLPVDTSVHVEGSWISGIKIWQPKAQSAGKAPQCTPTRRLEIGDSRRTRLGWGWRVLERNIAKLRVKTANQARRRDTTN